MSKNQRGNVLLIVLIGIVLFGALSYAVKSPGSARLKVDREQETLLIAEMMQYAQNIQTAVTNLRLNGCGDTQISFDSTETGTTYDNPFAPASGKCNVMASLGGPIPHKTVDTRLLDSSQSAQPLYGTYHITGLTSVIGIGSDYTCGNSNGKELILFVPHLKKSVCEAIAQRTNGMDVGNTLPQDWNIAYRTVGAPIPFKGVYIDACGFDINELTNPAVLNGKMSGCFEGNNEPPTGVYSYFQVLLVR